jgi:siroheme synthase
LLAHGNNPHTPAAVVHRASLPEQRVARGPLRDIAAIAARAELGAPAVVVIGAVVDVLAPRQ